MNLEDHLGDVIRKARSHARVSATAVAKAAGITAQELDHWEVSGDCPEGTDFKALGRVLGLDGAKLASLAAGWRPAAANTDTWKSLRQFSTSKDGNTVNCFLAWDRDTGRAALFDTGWIETPVAQFITERGLTLQHLFITHAHDDHVAAQGRLLRRFRSLDVHGGAALTGRQWSIGNLQVKAQATPGHADDGLIYVLTGWAGGAPPVAVVGDTLFAGSVARGFVSAPSLLDAIRRHILTLPPGTLLCPGHGPMTTVAEELAHNPFF